MSARGGGFASSTADLLIPLAVRFQQAGTAVSTIGFITDMAVASGIVGVSPFSTDGAPFLADAQGEASDHCGSRPVALGQRLLSRLGGASGEVIARALLAGFEDADTAASDLPRQVETCHRRGAAVPSGNGVAGTAELFGRYSGQWGEQSQGLMMHSLYGLDQMETNPKALPRAVLSPPRTA